MSINLSLPDDDLPDMQALLVKQQDLQALINRRLDVELDLVKQNQRALHARIQQLEGGTKLITINQLDVMLGAEWSEREKMRYGTSLGKHSRQCNVVPQKVAHPTVPGGVNGYEPGIVVDWLELEGFPTPEALRYITGHN